MDRFCQIRWAGLSLALLLLILLAGATPGQPARAQTAPTPADASISAIVGGDGAQLWDADSGAAITTLEPGAALVATARSRDGAWLWVTASSETAGWVAVADVLVFNEESLPAQEVTITPVTPTPEPTVAPVGVAAPVTATVIATATARTASQTAAQPAAASLAADQVRVQADRLNIRSGPGTTYAVVGKAQSGEQLTVRGRSDDGSWLQVTLSGSADELGWVAARYVTTGSATQGLPIAAAPADAPLAPVVDRAPVARATGGLAGKLVFQTSFGGPIYLYEFASGALRQVTQGFDPALSPDGTQIAFTRIGGAHGLYVINVDGSGERKIFGERTGFFAPKWSPDGQWIVFVRTDYSWKCKDVSEIYGFYHCQPDQPWDGAYPYRQEVRPRLARVDANGGNYRDIAGLDTASAPDWNSAGIIYASDAGIQITSDASQDPSRRVVFDIRQQYYQDPDWQPGPEGTPGRVVFQQRRPGHWQIFGVNPDGSGLTALTRPTTVLVDSLPSNVAPAWSPDGQHIVFLSNRTPQNDAGAWGIWVMNADGSNQRRLPIDVPFEYTYVEEQMIDWGP